MSDPFDELLHTGSAEPTAEFRARLMTRVSVALSDERAAGIDIDLETADPTAPHRRPRAVVVLALLAAAVIAIIVASMSGGTRSTVDPAVSTTTTSTSAAPRGHSVYQALRLSGNELVVDTGRVDDPALLATSTLAATADAAPLSTGSPWGAWGVDSPVITDIETMSAGYLATCCSPGSVMWRNGVPLPEVGAVTKFDLNAGERTSVDAQTGTVTIDGPRSYPTTPAIEPGAVDITWLDQAFVAILTRTSTTQVVVLNTIYPQSTEGRRTIALPSDVNDACAIVGLGRNAMLLLGQPAGADSCVGDRAVLLDITRGSVGAVLRLPTPVRAINSDHRSLVVAVTTDGGLVLCDFAKGIDWRTLSPPNGYLAASVLT